MKIAIDRSSSHVNESFTLINLQQTCSLPKPFTPLPYAALLLFHQLKTPISLDRQMIPLYFVFFFFFFGDWDSSSSRDSRRRRHHMRRKNFPRPPFSPTNFALCAVERMRFMREKLCTYRKRLVAFGAVYLPFCHR